MEARKVEGVKSHLTSVYALLSAFGHKPARHTRGNWLSAEGRRRSAESIPVYWWVSPWTLTARRCWCCCCCGDVTALSW